MLYLFSKKEHASLSLQTKFLFFQISIKYLRKLYMYKRIYAFLKKHKKDIFCIICNLVLEPSILQLMHWWKSRMCNFYRFTKGIWYREPWNIIKKSINGFTSESSVINHGVPQGGVLGPILFLLYINDIHACIKYSNTYYFVDDTNLLNISLDYKNLKKELKIWALLYNG